jgi:predicted DNA-binding protein YlxM (UPF0122 family)
MSTISDLHGSLMKDLSMTVLLDYYGSMLTQKQRDTMEMYYEQDFSLAEIAEQTGSTRQNALNCLQKSCDRLKDMERKLGFVRRTHELQADISELEGLILQSEMTNECVMADIDEKMVEIKTKL